MAERAFVVQMIQQAAQFVGSGDPRTDIIDNARNTIGSITWTGALNP
jgi:hypothetical protein